MLIALILCFVLAFGQPLALASPGPKLHFTVANWAYEVRGQDDYDFNTTGTFPKGERGYAYLEVAGFELATEEGWFVLRLNVDVALQTQKGFSLFSKENVLELEEWYLEPPESTWFYIWVDVPWWAPRGVYRTLITVRDLVNEESIQETREIKIF